MNLCKAGRAPRSRPCRQKLRADLRSVCACLPIVRSAPRSFAANSTPAAAENRQVGSITCRKPIWIASRRASKRVSGRDKRSAHRFSKRAYPCLESKRRDTLSDSDITNARWRRSDCKRLYSREYPVSIFSGFVTLNGTCARAQSASQTLDWMTPRKLGPSWNLSQRRTWNARPLGLCWRSHGKSQQENTLRLPACHVSIPTPLNGIAAAAYP